MNSAQILSKWSTVSLPSLQKLLDSQSLEIFSTQQTSLTSRRRLATLTKDFKKLENPNLLDFKTLLKEYQNEIDLINKRAKQVETWFIDIYKILVELPDPVNSLQELIEIEEKIKTETGVQVRNAELGKTVKVLSEEVERLRIVEEEKGLLVEKLRDLEGRVTHHSNSKVDGLVYEKSQLLLTDLQAELSQALLDHKETESALNRQISHLQSQFVTLQSSLSLTNATTLVEVKGNAEVEVLSEQVERLKEKLSSLSSQNFNLKEQIKVLQDESGSRLLKEGFEREKEGLRKDLEGVREEMEKVQIDKVKVVEDFKKTVSGLERQIGKLNTEVARLSTLLLEYSDYEQVKKELEIFKNMEGGYDDEDGHGNSGNVPLERIVLEKNKKLVNENTSLWVSLQD